MTNIEFPCPPAGRIRRGVIGTQIDVVSWREAEERVLGWAVTRESRYICICNVHSVVTATQERAFKQVLENADLATPDGAPVAWTLRSKGFRGQPRINGPDFMWRLCGEAERQGVSIGLYGSTPSTLSLLVDRLADEFPQLKVGYSFSPPFRKHTAHEDAELCEAINSTGIGLLFVGLGCPKQEFWMSAHRGLVFAPMIGVGAAFDYHAGTIKRAPRWMQAAGLEWLHRLCSEPRRLWRRYLTTNSLFLIKTLGEALRGFVRASVKRLKS